MIINKSLLNSTIMTTHMVKTVTFLLPAGFLILMLSCKMKHEEKIADNPPANNSIMLSEAQIKLANINTAEVREGTIGRKLSLTGVLKVNEQTAVTVSARVPGRIEKLYFRNTGETVNKGDKLYEYFSEELAKAQREYYTLQSNNWNFSGRYEPSLILEDKLLVLGLMPEQIKQMGKDGKILFSITIYSPVSGKIRAINVSEGQYLEEGQSMFELAEDNKLWVEAQVYPDDIQFLKTGMPAMVMVPAAGTLPVKSNVSFINPSFESGRNVTLVRAVINNPEGRLHPGMFAILEVEIQTTGGIVVPSSAVLTGSGGNRAWVRETDGSFTCRTVTTGLQSHDSVLVLSGLTASDAVVTSGVYLLNSEFILRQGNGSAEPAQLTENKLNRVEI